MRRGAAAVLLGLLAAVAPAQTVAVAAAANLAPLEAPLKAAFAQSHPGMSAQFAFGASGTLMTQLLQGAPYQVFLSADRESAQRLVDAGLARGPVVTYARGKLIVLGTRPFDTGRGLAILADPLVKQFAMANPLTAAYGRAAVEALTNAGLLDRVKSKIVTAQSVAQTLQFTVAATGFGLVSGSADVKGRWWFEVDPSLYAPLDQGLVVLTRAEAIPEVRAFREFLLSHQARAVFEEFGYTVPE